MSGQAGPTLLDTFTHERQPVGVDIVTRANNGMRDHAPWMELTGMLEPDLERRRAVFAQFDRLDEMGRERRRAFMRAIGNTSSEFHGLGIEMNQRYSSTAVYLHDEQEPPPLPEDPIKTHQITTYPGRRLPHAWLNTRIPAGQVSTIDLAGHGRFTLLTGPGGEKWTKAAEKVSDILKVTVKVFSIGWKQDYEDVYFDWARRREVEEDGCVLIRPDRFVAWRSESLVGDCADSLQKVMQSILCR